jgi:leucyl-tRNA synthetase
MCGFSVLPMKQDTTGLPTEKHNDQAQDRAAKWTYANIAHMN